MEESNICGLSVKIALGGIHFPLQDGHHQIMRMGVALSTRTASTSSSTSTKPPRAMSLSSCGHQTTRLGGWDCHHKKTLSNVNSIKINIKINIKVDLDINININIRVVTNQIMRMAEAIYRESFEMCLFKRILKSI